MQAKIFENVIFFSFVFDISSSLLANFLCFNTIFHQETDTFERIIEITSNIKKSCLKKILNHY